MSGSSLRRSEIRPVAGAPSGAGAGGGSGVVSGSGAGTCVEPGEQSCDGPGEQTCGERTCGERTYGKGPSVYLGRRNFFGRLSETAKDERDPGRWGKGRRQKKPMRILLLDTETNGLPANRHAPISMSNAWPHLLQLSWSVFRIEDGWRLVLEKSRDLNVALPAEVAWNTGAAAVHGMTEEEGRAGTPVATALTELAAVLAGVDAIVAHNLAFDKPVLRAAAYRVGLRGKGSLGEFWPDSGSSPQEFCTMVATRDLVKLPYPTPADYPRANPHKPPRMNELYNWLYGHVYDLSGGSFTALHSARTDTHCLSQCVAMLLRRGFLRVEANRLCMSAGRR